MLKINELIGCQIKDIYYEEDDDVEGRYSEEFGSYKLVVETCRNRLIFEGCHDCGPDVIIEDID